MKQLSLVQKFNLISLALLVFSSISIGYWVSSQIESRVVERIGHTSSLFAGSVIAPSIRTMLEEGYNAKTENTLINMLDETSLGEEIVTLKIWDDTGKILFSTNTAEIGKVYQMEAGLKLAWSGVVSAEISDLEREEHKEVKQQASKLLETYSPIREPGTGKILAVVEFYQTVSEIEDEIRDARTKSWIVVCLVLLAIYFSLIILVGRGSRTIIRQHEELDRRVQEYRSLLDRNTELTKRVQSSAVHFTALNEQYLRKIAAELHDGPAQDIGYSLLMLDQQNPDPSAWAQMKSALERSLKEIRNISAGLKSPELESLSMKEVVDKAVNFHRNRSGGKVSVKYEDLPVQTALAIKIAVFRVIQEALSNAHRHGEDNNPGVRVTGSEEHIRIDISDRGLGFSPGKPAKDGEFHLGISVMKERVELLGGIFEIKSSSSSGTLVQARIPLNTKGD